MISFQPLGVGLSSSTQATSYFWSFLQGYLSHKGRRWAKSLYCTQAQAKLQHLLLCEIPGSGFVGVTETAPPPHIHTRVNLGLSLSTSPVPGSVMYIFTFNPYHNS